MWLDGGFVFPSYHCYTQNTLFLAIFLGMSQSENVIVVSELTKKYGDFIAVDHISFDVRRGEIFGILGPNGAGKTTTLEMIEGLRRITAGDARLNAISVKDDPTRVKHLIGVQLQSASFYDKVNLKELLEFFGHLYGNTIDAMKLLEKVSLQDKWRSEARELSGGQRQRLSIAIALVNDPLILFLDEPTTGLDPQARHHLWDLVRDIQREGKTIILTTHYMEEAETLCDRIAIMDQAKIIALDTPRQLLKKIEQKATVQFHVTKAVNLEPLNRLSHVIKTHKLKDTVRISTSQVQATLKDLIRYDESHAVDFKDLSVHETNLEDVFLTLTGKQLRE